MWAPPAGSLNVAVMVTYSPLAVAFLPVTWPLLLTVASSVLLLLQVTGVSVGRFRMDSFTDLPVYTVGFSWLMAYTMIFTDFDWPKAFRVTVVLPPAMPLILALEVPLVAVAIFLLPEIQVMAFISAGVPLV